MHEEACKQTKTKRSIKMLIAYFHLLVSLLDVTSENDVPLQCPQLSTKQL